MSFQNILVPTDGSENTEAAIAKAIDLARALGGRITALYVKDKSATDETARAATSYVATEAEQAGVPCEESVLSGTPAEVIVKESPRYEIIVMGTLGRTGVKKMFAGSVAETVAKGSACPVIIVRKTE